MNNYGIYDKLGIEALAFEYNDTYKALVSANIYTIGNLTSYSEDELKELEGFTGLVLGDIEKSLDKIGLSLKEDETKDYADYYDMNLKEAGFTNGDWIFLGTNITTIGDLLCYTEDELKKLPFVNDNISSIVEFLDRYGFKLPTNEVEKALRCEIMKVNKENKRLEKEVLEKNDLIQGVSNLYNVTDADLLDEYRTIYNKNNDLKEQSFNQDKTLSYLKGNLVSIDKGHTYKKSLY